MLKKFILTSISIALACILFGIGLIFEVIKIPLSYEKIGEFENCSPEINMEFGGTMTAPPDYTRNPFKGDFIAPMTIEEFNMGCMINAELIDLKKHSYFFTYNHEIKSVKEKLEQRIILGKWPSAEVTFTSNLNDNKVRLYRINKKGVWWPKG